MKAGRECSLSSSGWILIANILRFDLLFPQLFRGMNLRAISWKPREEQGEWFHFF
jgi:hypothetical protein